MDKKIIVFFLCALIGIFAIPFVIFAASFNCSKASTKTEKAICADPILSKLDEDMAAAYSEALKTSDPDAVKKGQRKWLKEILAPCIEDRVCIKKAYENRLRQLESSAGNNADNNCFENIINSEDRLEIYPGSFWATNDISKKTYIQYKGVVPGLSDNASVLFDRGDKLLSYDHDRLCNNNIIIIWEEQETSHSPTLIYGKILDSNFKLHIDDFRIVENEKAQWGSSVGSLLNNNFVVTWQRLIKEKDNSTHTVIYARIFNSYGKPLCKSLEVSMKRGINSRAIVHGLPDGGFVILWERLRDSILLRIYNKDGSPRTKEISICKDNLPWPITPYVKVLSSGTINVFLVHDNYLYQNKPIELSRSYNSTGKALTNILDVHSSPQLEGYQDIVEYIVYENARELEDDLRRFINNDYIMNRDFCLGYKLDRKFRGNSLLKWTKSQSMIKYINDFYDKKEELCSKKIQK